MTSLAAQQVDLVKSRATTIPFELRSDVRTLCVSPDGTLLVAIDDTGRALVINRKQNALLHHFSFKDTVRVASFSPDGRYVLGLTWIVMSVYIHRLGRAKPIH